VIALSGPAQENNENDIKQTDTDTDNDSIGETIATMFDETTNEQQQNASNETTSIFKTPEKRDKHPILNLLRQATQKKIQLPTFDASDAFLNESTLSVSTKKSDDIAFLVGPRRDGIIKSHTLSPIPIHANTYQPLYIKDDETLLTFHANETTLEQSASVDKNENDKHLNKRKRKKKTPDAITLNKRKNLDFDFTDEGYPLALFQFGGEQMKNDYETNKRSRTPSPTSSTDSKASLEIYYKAQRTYPPEIDESNAESAERTKLIDQKIKQLKQNRIKRKEESQQRNEKQVYTNNTQTYDFPESLPDNNPGITTHQIDVIFDTGATFSMLPGQFEFAWTELKPCLHTIEGCFKGVGTDKETQMGEFHALFTLDSGEVRRAIIPQAIVLPQDIANSYLLATTPFLIAENRYVCDLQEPRIWLKGGGKQTMSVIRGHHVIHMTPIDAHTTTPHKTNLFHLREPYDPPSFINNSTHTQNANRPNTNTPTAFIYHLRYGCASEVVLQRTQHHVIGMQVRKDSWKILSTQLPCNACLAGKMRKTKKGTSSTFTNVKNLALSWTPATGDKKVTPN
jgi:hypothetical protein